MTAEELLSKEFEIELKDFNDVENGIANALEYEYHRVNGADKVIKAMQNYARIKCLEAIKNTRHKIVDLMIEFDMEHDVYIELYNSIQNIPEQDIMPEL